MVFWAMAALAKLSRESTTCWLMLLVMAALAPKVVSEEVSRLMSCASVNDAVQWETQFSDRVAACG
jgi:hypothetical protein